MKIVWRDFPWYAWALLAIAIAFAVAMISLAVLNEAALT